MRAAKKLGLLVWFTSMAMLGGCGSVSHYGPRPNLEVLELGMSSQTVIENVGRPAMQESKGEIEALIYGWDDPWDSVIGTTEEYFVLFRGNRLTQYGMLTKGAAKTFGVWRAIENASAVAFPDRE